MQTDTSLGIKIYPNPCHSYFTASVTSDVLPAVVRIYDMNGKICLKQNIGTGQTSVTIYFGLIRGKDIVEFEDNLMR